ncbi:MAG: Hsp20/alpha crystallin family protein [Deltaproteobacteria bacterium]|nr:Hsp20/alpha crystallin family protein [Deltaproteobacteria bacterium]
MIIKRYFDTPTLWWRSPFEELDRMRRDLERAFEEFPRTWPGEVPRGVFPLTNITEDKNNFYLRAELPGIKAKGVEISITGNSISISGERMIAAEDEKVKYHRREREAGKFRRMIKLPHEIDTDKVEAKSTNGVLAVLLPKKEAAKPKQISVRVS